MEDINVGDIIMISCSGVQTYHRMVHKHPDGGGEFLTVLRDGSRDPGAPNPKIITREDLVNSDGIRFYIPY